MKSILGSTSKIIACSLLYFSLIVISFLSKPNPPKGAACLSPLKLLEEGMAREVYNFSAVEDLHAIGEAFPEMFTFNVTKEQVDDARASLEAITLEEIVNQHLFTIYGNPSTLGRIMMSAAANTIRQFAEQNPGIFNEMLKSQRMQSMDDFLANGGYGTTIDKAIAIISDSLKSQPSKSEEFKQLLVTNAFDSEDRVKFLAETSGAKFYVYENNGKKVVIKFSPTKGANERDNVVTARYLWLFTAMVAVPTTCTCTHGTAPKL